MENLSHTEMHAIAYPAEPIFAKQISWERYRQCGENWSYSQRTLHRLNAELNAAFGPDDSFSVLVAGSYGRMDAHAKSDLDFMIVHNGRLIEGKKKVEIVRQCANGLGIETPNPEGAFSRPIQLSDMVQTIGSMDDDLNSTAQRLLILMEGRPIFNSVFFEQIMFTLIERYMKYVDEEPEKEALVLLNDLIRYFRGICINVEFNFWKDDSKWGIRNIKLRHSRILIYTGLLFLIMTSSMLPGNKLSFIRENLFLSPMEKVFKAYQINKDFNFERVIGAYDTFLHRIMQDSVRNELKCLDYRLRFTSRNYAELRRNSDFLQSEFTRFILDNRARWTSKVFEYLIF